MPSSGPVPALVDEPTDPSLVDDDESAPIDPAPLPPPDLCSLVSSAALYSSLASKFHEPQSKALFSLSRLRYSTAADAHHPTISTIQSLDMRSLADDGPLIDRATDVYLTAKVRVFQLEDGTTSLEPPAPEPDSVLSSTGLKNRKPAPEEPLDSDAPVTAADAYYDTLAEVLPYAPKRLASVRSSWEKAIKSLPAIVNAVNASRIVTSGAPESPK
jgi:hypothetical protein